MRIHNTEFFESLFIWPRGAVDPRSRSDTAVWSEAKNLVTLSL
jgi:hypothetical protein